MLKLNKILTIKNNYNNYKHSSIIYRNYSIYKNLTGGQVIYNELKKLNVDTIFGFSGGAIMPVMDTLYKSDINLIVNTHEQSTGHSATGYAKSSNKPGIMFVTSGPGLTNSITPMLDAQNDSTPLIVFSGNVPLKAIGTQAFQECPATEMTKPFTKWSVVANNVNDLPYIIRKAWKIATSGKPGCVHIDLPKCISTSIYTSDENDDDNKYVEGNVSNLIDSDVIDWGQITNMNNLSNLINKSEKPIIILGKGANKYPDYIYSFVLCSNIPVTTTIHAVGLFPENNSLSLKWLGMHGSPAANFAISEADLIINIGSRFDDRTTGNIDNYAPNAYKAYKNGTGGIIHVNIDNSEINKNIKSHYNYNMDTKIFLKNIDKFIKYKNREPWMQKIYNWQTKYPFEFQEPDNNKLNTQMVIKKIGEYLYENENWKITTGVGNHQMWAAQFIDYYKPESLITSGSLGVMGAGIGYAIGTQLANPLTKVILIDGDGSFNMTLPELHTIMKYNLPIKIALMNDNNMSMVRTWEKLFFEERYVATDLSHNPDYIKLAKSYGMTAIKCDNKNDLNKTVENFINYNGPILCEFKTLSEMCYPLVAPGKALNDMILFQNKNSINNLNKSEIPS